MKLIAEVGSNWITADDCKESIRIAKACGADAVKFQWFGSGDLYGVWSSRVQMPLVPSISVWCDEFDLEFMCTFFDAERLALFDSYVDTHKIASSNMMDKELLSAVLETGKPFYLSTGGHTLAEVEEILKWMDLPVDDGRLTLMYCESAYPAYCTDFEKFDLLGEFGYPVGLSDHSMELFTIPGWAKSLGATALEKHVNLAGVEGTPDAPHSLSADQFSRMVARLKGEPVTDILSPEEQHMRDYNNARQLEHGFYRKVKK